ncbi:MAG: proton-conducting transporter membrane subunit [Elusimicrobiota bacterium]
MSTLLILAPLAGIIILNLPFWQPKRIAFWFASALFLFQIWLALSAPASFKACIPVQLPFLFNMSVDSFSIVLILSIGIVAFASLLLAQQTVPQPEKRFWFTNLLLLAVLGMNGAVMVTDLFTLYVFLEIIAVSAFVMIAFRQDRFALEGALKYLILSSLATVLMLFSIAFLMLTAGSTAFADIHAAIMLKPGGTFTTIAMALFVCGLFIKGGLVPFHWWVPDAYSSAPDETSVLLAGIVTKTSGIYALMRLVMSVFGFTPQLEHLLLAAGAVSAVFGALAALPQKDMKRMLAYSSISQVGYIILGLGSGTGLGFAGAVFHLFNHSIFKAQLFVNAAAIEKMSGTRDMNRLGGLAGPMPRTCVTTSIAFLSTAGIPPLAGFWSKLIIIMALFLSGHQIYALIAVLASVITLAYLLSMNRKIFFGDVPEEFKHVKEACAGMLFPAVILSIITVGTGILFPFVINKLILPLMNLL